LNNNILTAFIGIPLAEVRKSISDNTKPDC